MTRGDRSGFAQDNWQETCIVGDMSRSQNAPLWHWVYVVLLISTVIWASNHSRVAAPSISNFDKLAHFSVFGLMGTLVLRQLGQRRWWLALLLVSLFGASDEIHQHFTPGRSSDIRDWIADTSGAAVAIAAYCLIGPYRRLLEWKLWTWRRRKKTLAGAGQDPVAPAASAAGADSSDKSVQSA
ncbi:teicoplanin resistance protein VanZ [Opitutaceae bacterium TAV5]|nr:teicoplanin resistance protein VanZ [Opitutaceae bacterium TAV5]